jgi:hypothetical protein
MLYEFDLRLRFYIQWSQSGYWFCAACRVRAKSREREKAIAELAHVAGCGFVRLRDEREKP